MQRECGCVFAVAEPCSLLTLRGLFFHVRGDGQADIATTNVANNDVSILIGSSNGVFSSSVTEEVGARPTAITSADFNGDGITDLATSNIDSHDVSEAISKSDFNGDGIIDLAVNNRGTNDVSILLGSGGGTFEIETFTAREFPNNVLAGDFNGDGLTDLAAANQFGSSFSVLLNQGNNFVTLGDVNGDCEVNLLDDAPFVALLAGVEFQLEADINEDGVVDLLDVQPFVDLLAE